MSDKTINNYKSLAESNLIPIHSVILRVPCQNSFMPGGTEHMAFSLVSVRTTVKYCVRT
jgi:hypothetical protein